MRARGPQAAEEAAELALGSAAAKRAFFASAPEPNPTMLSYRQQQILRDAERSKTTAAEIVRVRCGDRIHRLRLHASGGPAVLLDHPHLDRKAKMALVALGAPRPDCLLVFDAITGHASTRRILWRRRAYPIAERAAIRRYCRRHGARPLLEQPVAERYANFVRHRASLWLDKLLPAGAGFEVLVIPPTALQPRPPSGSMRPWSWRCRPGFSLRDWGGMLQVHIPFDWCVSVERPLESHLQTGFIFDARSDRRGQMVRRLDCKVIPINRYLNRFEWSKRTEDLESVDRVAARRWQRAKRSCRIVLPNASPRNLQHAPVHS